MAVTSNNGNLSSSGPLPLVTQSPHRSPNKQSMKPNVENIVLGSLHVKPWYPSFYPEDLTGGKKTPWLYICQWCFKYTTELLKYSVHCKVCPLKSKPPPGQIVYDKDDLLIHKLDGEEHKLYCQNLSLLAKLFLETKSVFFDSTTFLYHTLLLRTPEHPMGLVAGFFSKEKMSWDNNNLACILVFPPYQRRGLGQVLIGASYVLGRKEGRFGGPERPLSELGKKGYLAYWCGEVARWILSAEGKRKTVSVREISEATWIMAEDVVAALKEMDVLEKRKTGKGSVVVSKSKVQAWVERQGISLEPVVDLQAFVEEDAEDDSGEEEGADDDPDDDDESELSEEMSE